MRRFVLFVIGLCTVCGCASRVSRITPRSQYALIAYVYASRDADLSWIDAARLTHVNYAFANVDSTGAVVLERARDKELLAQLRSLRSRNPDLKILLSVGGWTWSDHFSDAALTDASRARFASTGAALAREYGLDGLDLDWEYPGQAGDGNKYRPEDRDNFTLLLRDVRAELDRLSDEKGRPMLLTIASGANQTYLEHTNLREAHQYLDFINVMTYDFYGDYTATTGHHTNLSPADAPRASGASVVTGIKAYLEAEIPAEKLVVGAAFYGKGWSGVTATSDGRYQPYERYYGGFSYERLASDFINKNGFERRWDDSAQAPYLWHPDSLIFISYDDPESVRFKAQFVRDNGLGGMMWWEHTQDPSQVLLRAMDEELNSD